jgi:hypothetical protein
MLLKLWDRMRVLPSYYLLQGGVQKCEEVSSQPSYYANIRKGTHAGDTVTVKVYKSSDPHAAQVSTVAMTYIHMSNQLDLDVFP